MNSEGRVPLIHVWSPWRRNLPRVIIRKIMFGQQESCNRQRQRISESSNTINHNTEQWLMTRKSTDVNESFRNDISSKDVQADTNNGIRDGVRKIMILESSIKQPGTRNIEQWSSHKKQVPIIKNHTDWSSIWNDFWQLFLCPTTGCSSYRFWLWTDFVQTWNHLMAPDPRAEPITI